MCREELLSASQMNENRLGKLNIQFMLDKHANTLTQQWTNGWHVI